MIPREGANAIPREKLLIVQHDSQNAPKLLRIEDGEQQALAFPLAFMQATFLVKSGRFRINHSIRRLKPGGRLRISGSSVSTANKGISPTVERTRIG